MSFCKAFWAAGWALVLISLATDPTSAQTTFATITGTVTDSSGAVVPGVSITATHVPTNIQIKTQSNEAGMYTLAQLKEGEYTLRANLVGFKEFAVRSIMLVARDLRRVDVRLEVGELATGVEVQSGATLIETDTSRINETRTTYELKTLPLNTRGIWAYLSLTPSVVQRAGGSSTISFAGSRTNQSQWAIDGTTMSDGVNETQIGPLANFIESFREVKIEMANNSAEFGTLGMVTIVSKSGTNELHGSVFDYYVSPILRTRDPFATARGGGVSHNIGFSLGGPVYIPKIYDGKNRTFFFISTETFTGSQATAQLNPTVPLESWRRGDFSALGIQIRNPFTNQIYTDGRIPPEVINSVSRRIQERFYPLPNFGNPNVLTASNYRATLPRPFDTPYYMVARLDQKLSDKDAFFVRYTVNQQKVAVWEGNLPSFGPRQQFRRNKALTSVYTHTFTARLLNEFRFGHTFNNNPLQGPLNGLEVIRDLGIQGLAPNLPNIGGVFKVDFSGLGLTRLSQIDWTRPGFLNKIDQFQDQVSYFVGRHSFKTGLEIRKVRWQNASAGANLFGNVTFANTYTRVPGVPASGHPYADFLFGVPTSAARNFPPVLIERSRWMYDFFFHDDWKIRPRLTLNLGVRYEYHPVWQEDNGLTALFDVVSGKLAVDDRGLEKVSPLVPPGYVEIVKASSLGLPSRTLVRSDKYNFAPRFGLAYRPFNSAATVLRAGYGIYYDTTPINPSQGGSPFVVAEPSFTNTTPNPTLVLPQAFPAGGTGIPSTITLPAAINPDLKMPYSQQWNLTIEHQRWETGFRLSYIGTNSRQMRYNYNINSPVVDDRLFITKPRRFMRYPSISYFDNGANHNYHAFTAEAERKMSNGLFFQSSYTWARDVGDATEGSIENPFDRRRERAVEQHIPTHRLTNGLIYQLPFGKGRRWMSDAPRGVELALGGWEISMISYHQTGMFLTPTVSIPDPTGTAFTTSANRPLVTIRPDQLRNPNLTDPTIDRWFDVGALAPPPIGRFGNAARGVVIGPGTNVFHVGFHKYFTFSENPRVPKFRIELTSTNFFNHPNWGNPTTDLSSIATVATIRSAGGPNTSSTGDQAGSRSLRVGLRAEW